MDMRKLYSSMGVEYDDVLALLRKEDRIKLYFTQMMTDPSFDELEQAMAKREFPTAFKAAHTIKGMSMNLMVKPLSEASIALVECLRSETVDESEAASLYARLREQHDLLSSQMKEPA